MRVWIYLFIVLTGLLLLFFSNPNRLAHDQIDHRLYQIKYLNSGTFKNDYLAGSEKMVLMDNRFSFKILAAITQITKSDEITRWVLLPVIFIVFTIGFFELIYFLTHNIIISLLVALAANYHVPHIFTAEWGLPGPSELDPWTFYQMFLPILFLSLYVSFKNKSKLQFLITIFCAGVLANIHIITAFNFVGASIIAYILANKKTIKNVSFAMSTGLLALCACIPYLMTHYVPGVSHIASFNPNDPDAWAAIKIIANHTTIGGKLLNIKVWIIDYWYTIIPFIVICLIYLINKGRKRIVLSKYDHFSLNFSLGILIFNIFFSLTQLFRLYVLHQLPFWNEPRGIQLIYLVLFSYLGIILLEVWNTVKPYFTFSKTIPLLFGIMVLATTIFWRFQPLLSTTYIKHIQPRFSYYTCESKIYRALNAMALSPDTLIMQEPDFWSAFRICTNLSSVVQNRDKALAYSFGSDMMLTWYRRYQDVTRAFSVGGTQLVEIAEKYHANIIVSRYCATLPPEKILRHEIIANEGCIDILQPPDSAPL